MVVFHHFQFRSEGCTSFTNVSCSYSLHKKKNKLLGDFLQSMLFAFMVIMFLFGLKIHYIILD